jgi:menaquinone-dependent protoporphyrinogen oxidase
MPIRVLVGYATRYGSTQQVAEAIGATLREPGLSPPRAGLAPPRAGLAVDVQLLREVRTITEYDAVVVGAPLFMFHWHKEAHSFLSRQREALMQRRIAIYALGPVHEPHDEAEWRDSRVQLDKELAQYPWLAPLMLEMFGGKYDPEKLGFPLKMLAGKEPASDIRDWTAIRQWANSLATRLRGEP